MIPEDAAPINGFPAYRISRDGMVWSCWKNVGKGPRMLGDTFKSLRLTPDPQGYLQVSLRNYENRAYKRVHVLVLEAFVGPRPKGYEAAHKDSVNTNNHVDNLKWATPLENQHDRSVHGTNMSADKGNHPTMKLSNDQVDELRLLHESGVETRKSLSVRFGITGRHVYQIVTGRRRTGSKFSRQIRAIA